MDRRFLKRLTGWGLLVVAGLATVFGIWAIGAAAFSLVVGLGLPELIRRFAPDQAEVVAALFASKFCASCRILEPRLGAVLPEMRHQAQVVANDLAELARLRREIATTQLVNQMVNLSGISYDHRMTEDTGASVTDVARAYGEERDAGKRPVEPVRGRVRAWA